MFLFGLLLFLVSCLLGFAAWLQISGVVRVRRTDFCQPDGCLKNPVFVRAVRPALLSATGPPGFCALWRRSDSFSDFCVRAPFLFPAVQHLHHFKSMMPVTLW
jgi:hypothetical protein